MSKRRNVHAASLADRRFAPRIVHVKKNKKIAAEIRKECDSYDRETRQG